MNPAPQPQPATSSARPQPACGSPLPFLIAAALLLILLAWLAFRSAAANGGRLVYTLDDAYIHLAMARNAVAHGQLGINAGEFSAASSSPLWSALLVASMHLAGNQEWLPLFWAALAAVGCLWRVDRLCASFGMRAPGRLAAALAFIHVTPLPALVSTGMEHTMHLFFLLVLVERMLDLLDSDRRGSVPRACLAAALATGFRYETLFLVAPLSLALWHRRGFRAGALLSAAAFVPVVVFGWYSLAHGSGFLPNSIELKGHFPSSDGLKDLVNALGYRGFGILTATPHLLSGVILLLAGMRRQPAPAGPLFWLSACVATSTVIHLQFAQTGWFFRYEAYLAGLFVPVLAGLLRGRESVPRKGDGVEALLRGGALAAMALLLVWPLHKRGKEALEEIIPAAHDIFRQQRQTADFLKSSFPPGTRVAVNDLGLVAYDSGCRVLDLWGLGSREVTLIRKQRRLGAADVAALVERAGTRYVIIYDEWFPERPDLLLHAGNWTLEKPYFPVWNTRVTFYGVGAEAARELSGALETFAPRLPATVRYSREPPPAAPPTKPE